MRAAALNIGLFLSLALVGCHTTSAELMADEAWSTADYEPGPPLTVKCSHSSLDHFVEAKAAGLGAAVRFCGGEAASHGVTIEAFDAPATLLADVVCLQTRSFFLHIEPDGAWVVRALPTPFTFEDMQALARKIREQPVRTQRGRDLYVALRFADFSDVQEKLRLRDQAQEEAKRLEIQEWLNDRTALHADLIRRYQRELE